MTPPLLADGFMFTEGPLWLSPRDAERNGWDARAAVLVSDVEANSQHLVRFGTETDTTASSVVRRPSNESNGNALGPDGMVWSCEHGMRRVSRRTGDGGQVTVVDLFEGRRLNSPNDLCTASDGSVFFTDPPYGVADHEREIDFHGVYRIDTAGEIHLVDDSLIRPNGVAMDPGGRDLWVADTETGHIFRFGFDDDHAVNGRTIVATTGRPDGMAFDSEGGLLIAGSEGIVVIDRDGTTVSPTIELPQRPANLCFAGSGLDELIVCARTAVYRLPWPRPGLPLVGSEAPGS